jgi:hypothetical protein
MIGVLLFLLFVPLVLAGAAFISFRFLAVNYGPRALAACGIVWVSALLYWTFGQDVACEPSTNGQSDTGCGFISFLGPFETASAGAASLLTLVCLIFWLHRARTSSARGGGRQKQTSSNPNAGY